MQINSTSTIHQGPIKMLIYGKSGVGKTTLAKTLDQESTLILSAEGGLLSLKGSKVDYVDLTVDDEGVTLSSVERLGKIREVYEFLLSDEAKKKYKTVFVDSLSEIAQTILEVYQARQETEIAKGKKPDGFALWGDYTKKFVSLVKSFRDLPHYNVVLTCLEEIDKDESGRRFYAPAVPGKAASQFIVPSFDVVFRLTADVNQKRHFTTSATPTEEAKCRGLMLPQLVEATDLRNILGQIQEEKKEKENGSTT